MEIKIKKTEERHLPALAQIEKECFSAPWSEQAIREELLAGHLFLTAEDEQEQVLGYVGCQLVLDEGYITNVAVTNSARRQGVARTLLQVLRQHAQARGASFITLEVRASNLPAIRLYENAGYQIVGRRKGFYTAPKEDALLMTLTL